MSLLALECRRSSLRTYRRAALICGAVLLGFRYFMAAVPYLDPSDPDTALLGSYRFLFHLNHLLALAAFGILGGVLGARLVVEAYSPRRALALFCYPMPRARLLGAKLWLAFLVPFAAMWGSELAGLGVFLGSERLWPLCPGPLTAGDLAFALGSLAAGSLTAGCLSLWAVWLGFQCRSVPVTIVAAVGLVTLYCQVLSAAYQIPRLMAAGAAVAAVGAGLAAVDLLRRVERMEV